MPTTQFSFCAVNDDLSQAPFNGSATHEIKTPSGTSSATTAAANESQNICRVATDTAVYVAFASTPTASATAGFLCPANTVLFFRVRGGDKAAVVTI
jgi:hypothetical protein